MILFRDKGCTGTFSNPNLSISSAVMTCPVMTITRKLAAPITGTVNVPVTRKNTPIMPPNHAHHGARITVLSGSGVLKNRISRSIRVMLTSAETSEAVTGFPRRRESSALALPCTGKATPAKKASSR